MKLSQEFDFDIEYVKGKENVVANVLLKRSLANAISCITNSLIDVIKMNNYNDDFLKIPFKSLSKEARTMNEIDDFKFFELKDEVLYHNGRVCIPRIGEIDSTL